MYRVRLPGKTSAELCYSLFQTPANDASTVPPRRLIVFLNNLLMPASSWETPIALLNQQRNRSGLAPRPDTVPILVYDRFGQGATLDHDPLDSRPSASAGYGHDFADVVADLRSLITLIGPQIFPRVSDAPVDGVQLLLVGASIGAPLARLYAETFPQTVSGIVLLDSNIANANYSSFWPDPSAPDFDPESVVAPDCTLEQYIEATKALAAMFDLDVKNREGLDRRNTPDLLPHADRPRLLAPRAEHDDGQTLTKVLVVGHDPEAFADEGFERMGTPRSFTKRWLQSVWDKYNQGLLEVGDSKVFGEEVRIAKGCGHFIQRDDPGFVAQVVGEMMRALAW